MAKKDKSKKKSFDKYKDAQNTSENDIKNEELEKDEEATKDFSKHEKKVQELEKENAELLAKLQRVCADYDNYQKRVPKQIEDSVAYQKESLIKAILPGIDNFNHALSSENNHDAESILKGIKIVYQNFLDILKAQGVEQISAAGEKFDPSMHQAMMQRAEEDKEDGIVLEEYQKGYKYKDRVIRPAMVIVNKLPEAPQEQAPEKAEEQDDSASKSENDSNNESNE